MVVHCVIVVQGMVVQCVVRCRCSVYGAVCDAVQRVVVQCVVV